MTTSEFNYTPLKSTTEIDPDKTVANPGLIQFPHNLGSAVIKPEDAGKIKSKALSTMKLQTEKQFKHLYEHMQLLAKQAQELKNRVEISERIYLAEIKFEPVIGENYFLYRRPDGSEFLSMISPEERGKSLEHLIPVSKVILLPDYTWEVLPA